QQAERCFLGASVVDQKEDLRQYIVRRFADPQLGGRLGLDQTEIDRSIAIVAERSAGNFQYAETVLTELRSGALAVDQIDGLPSELAALYYRLADQRFPTRRDF